MTSKKAYLIYKEIFDEAIEKPNFTEENLNVYINAISNDESLNDRHYEILRSYFLKKYYSL